MYRGDVFGGLPEWPMGADCKSAGLAFSGSNPLPTTSALSYEAVWRKNTT